MADEKPILDEVSAVSSLDVTRGFIDPLLLRSEDEILRARGGDYKVYRNLLQDDQVQSTFQQRRLAVVAREMVVEPGGDRPIDIEAADALKQNLESIRWDDHTQKMLYGVFYGYAVAEMIWKLEGRRVVIDDIRVRRRERFRFGSDRTLRLMAPGRSEGIVMPERKFWTFSTGADNDDEPYGVGLGHWLYWPVFFKRNDIKFWLIFLEKFGSPTAVGTYPPSATDDEKDRLLQAAAAVQQEAAVRLPDGFEIILLEAVRSGAADYHQMAEKMDSAIAKVVLSQTMTTDNGSSQSQANVHMDVRQEVVKADSDLCCGAFNDGPARWLTEWNFPGAEIPRVWRRVEDEPDLKVISERDKNLRDLGFEPTPQYIEETYGEGFVRAQKAPAVNTDPQPGNGERNATAPGKADDAGPEPTFAEPAAEETQDDDSIDDMVAEMLDGDGWLPMMEPIVAPIRALLDDGGSLEEARRRLAEAVAGMDVEAFAEAMARAQFAARAAAETGADITDAE